METQLKQIVEVVGNALKGVSARHQEIERTKEIARNFTEKAEARTRETMDKIEKGIYHDPRLDAVAGTGVTSELGVGDEKMTEKDLDKRREPSKPVKQVIEKTQETMTAGKEAVQGEKDTGKEEEKAPTKAKWAKNPVKAIQGAVQGVVKDSKEGAEKLITGAKDQLGLSSSPEEPGPTPEYSERTEIDEEIRALPVIVIKNYASKTQFTDELVTVLAEWSAGLVDNGVAHVVVMSDNRDNGRKLEKGEEN
jgi:hypothetical protein